MRAIKKKITLLARKAERQEEVITLIDGNDETRNTAKVGDIIVTGTKEEKYVMSQKTLDEKYNIEPINHKRNEYNFFNIHSKQVEVNCEENKDDITFIASWGEEMKAKKGDYLIIEDGEISYCIDREVFFNTYELIDDMI